MTVTWTNTDLTAEEVMQVIRHNYNVEGNWENRLIDNFFNEIVEQGENHLATVSFKKLDYDEPFGSGTKHLYMQISKPVPVAWVGVNTDYTKRTRQVGVFRLTGWFNSWDNGDGPGYWEDTLTRVYPQVVEKFEYLEEPPKENTSAIDATN